MSVRGVLARARRAAKARMLDRCQVRREDPTQIDSKTGVAVMVDVVATACRLDNRASQEEERDMAGQQVTLQRASLDVPIEVEMLRLDDLVEVIESLTDPQLVGRVFRITAMPAASQTSARRYGIEEGKPT